MRALYTVTIFLNAFLLFLVQPLIAKQVLPVFGGSPLVWNAALLFFQVTLLAGYATAHKLLSISKLKTQVNIHRGLFVLAAVTLPIRLPGWFLDFYKGQLIANPTSLMAHPSLNAILLLAISVGLPFLFLSTGAPVLQRWFSLTDDPAAQHPYFLYAASNVGSLLALVAFPFILEPTFSTHNLAIIWSLGMVVLFVCYLFCARTLGDNLPAIEQEAHDEKVRWQSKAKWAALGAGPSAALVGVTNYTSVNIAPMPLLWVMPLSLYLISFIFAFSNSRLAKPKYLGWLMAITGMPALLTIFNQMFSPIQFILPLHFVAFFVAALACHCAVSYLKPKANDLSTFYLWLSIGGAIGGFCSAILAPMLLHDYFEYPIALVFCAVVFCLAIWGIPKPKALLFYAIGTGETASLLVWSRNHPPSAMVGNMSWWGYLAILLLVISAIKPRLQASIYLAALCAGLFMFGRGRADDVHEERSIYGVHVVRRLSDHELSLVNGNTIHGVQDSNLPRAHTSYYPAYSGIGRVFATVPPEHLKNCAFVGLGVGTLASYGQAGMNIDFYELDPTIQALSASGKYFTYLRDCPSTVQVKIGDARLRLADAPDHSYNLIVLDAFASDAIPVHLMTLEAFQLYLNKLTPNGILVVHVSNRYLDLGSVVRGAAEKYGLTALQLDTYHHKKDHPRDERSHWIVVAHKPDDMVGLQHDPDFHPIASKALPWTDDYSNVLSVLNLQSFKIQLF